MLSEQRAKALVSPWQIQPMSKLSSYPVCRVTLPKLPEVVPSHFHAFGFASLGKGLE